MTTHLHRAIVLFMAGASFVAPEAAAQRGKPVDGITQDQLEEGELGKQLRLKAGYEGDAGFGGPGSVGGQLDEDDTVKEPALRFPTIDAKLKPWFDFKKKLHEKHGLLLGFDYSALYQHASDELVTVFEDGSREKGENEAASGVFRFFGRWDLYDRHGPNKGTLVFKVEHRHRLGTDLPPSALGFEVGYHGLTGTLFSGAHWVLNDFNWQQNLNGGRSGFIIGRYDPSDYLDVHGFANPWTTFQNLSILFNPSIALPDTSVGLGFGHYFNDQWYGLATANDANGVLDDIGFFEDGFELYKSVELGWSPSRDQRYFKNAHVTAWHTDTRHNAGVPESWGVAATANWTFKEKWGPFARVGFSEGDAPLLNKSVTAGLIRYFEKRSDLFGLGVNWGEPAADSLRDQYTVEMFYRLQLAQNVAITPSVQFLIDPAGNPTESDTTVFGLRARFTF